MGVSALSLEYNYIIAKWKPIMSGTSAVTSSAAPVKMEFEINPDLPLFDFEMSDQKLPEGIKFECKESYRKNTWYLTNDEILKGEQRMPVKYVSLYTSEMFAKLARIRGIKIKMPFPKKTPFNANLLYVQQSKDLLSLVDTMMTYSINSMAELLFLNSARSLKGDYASFKESGNLLKNFFETEVGKADWSSFKMVNGSGLTSSNRITPEQMAALLIYSDSLYCGNKNYIDLLQPSGWDWSLRRRFEKKWTEFHIYAKTGYINYCVALSGYFYNKEGKKIIFVFFNSDISKRLNLEQNPDRFNKIESEKCETWAGSYTSAMDNMISKWIYEF